jgi:hypothetical protein
MARCEPLRQKHRDACHVDDSFTVHPDQKASTKLVDASGHLLGLLEEVQGDDE